MQERGRTAGLRPPSLDRSSCKPGPELASETLLAIETLPTQYGGSLHLDRV